MDNLTLPPRSILYNLVPIGLGTPYVESLSSYISRLADSHSLNVTKLVCNTFIPFVKKYHLKQSFKKNSLGRLMKPINGNSSISLDYVSALEELTTRKELLYLTMNSWSGLFSDNVIGDYRKWCPVCLEEWKDKGKEIYEPLIWYIKGIEVCDKHYIRLEDRCTNCEKQLSFLHNNFIVGHCQYCFTWLGNCNKGSINPSEFQLFLLDSFKALIANNQKLDYFPTNIKIGKVLKKIIDENNFSSITQFAKYINVHRAAVPYWIKSERKPTLESMFKICKKLNLTIYDLFCTNSLINVNVNIQTNKRTKLNLNELELVLKNAVESNRNMSLYQLSLEKDFDINTTKRYFPDLCRDITNSNLKHKRDCQNKKKKEVEQKLKIALEKERPMSLKQFSLTFGISIYDVKKYCPDLSKKLINRLSSYKRRRNKLRSEKIKNEMREVVWELHKNGIYPSDKAIRKKLSNPNFLVVPEY
ncbi:TniQ family protein, partial [Salipaludibacillus sp. CF4.18]|uniref:TniQ family protein n=1 Tax=Salipaludibacillus sp. CF4.18 TaxID=3373081 RepID=UPI003EE61D1F